MYLFSVDGSFDGMVELGKCFGRVTLIITDWT